jgi:hypothetical protein
MFKYAQEREEARRFKEEEELKKLAEEKRVER